MLYCYFIPFQNMHRHLAPILSYQTDLVHQR